MKIVLQRPVLTLKALSPQAWIFITITTVAGALSAVVKKNILMTKSPSCKGCSPSEFNHPYILVLLMFFGEALGFFFNPCLPKSVTTKIEGQARPSTRALLLLSVPAALDLVSSALANVGLGMTSASLSTALRGSNVIFVALFSFMGFPAYRNAFDVQQGVGISLLVVGCLFLMRQSDAATGGSQPLLGAMLTLASAGTCAAFQCIEEGIVKRHGVPGPVAVGAEGAWGILLSGATVACLSVGKRYEDAAAWAQQTANSSRLVLLQLGYIGITIANNLAGVFVTKLTDTATRTVFAALRPFLVWALQFAAGRERFNVGLLLSFALCGVAVLLYNTVLSVCFARPRNAKRYLGFYGTVELQATGEAREVARDAKEA